MPALHRVRRLRRARTTAPLLTATAATATLILSALLPAQIAAVASPSIPAPDAPAGTDAAPLIAGTIAPAAAPESGGTAVTITLDHAPTFIDVALGDGIALALTDAGELVSWNEAGTATVFTAADLDRLTQQLAEMQDEHAVQHANAQPAAAQSAATHAAATPRSGAGAAQIAAAGSTAAARTVDGAVLLWAAGEEPAPLDLPELTDEQVTDISAVDGRLTALTATGTTVQLPGDAAVGVAPSAAAQRALDDLRAAASAAVGDDYLAVADDGAVLAGRGSAEPVRVDLWPSTVGFGDTAVDVLDAESAVDFTAVSPQLTAGVFDLTVGFAVRFDGTGTDARVLRALPGDFVVDDSDADADAADAADVMPSGDAESMRPAQAAASPVIRPSDVTGVIQPDSGPSDGGTEVEIAVAGLPRFTQVAAGGTHSLALASDGSMYAWGANGSGQLGNGTTVGSTVPVLVSRGVIPAGVTIIQVAAGEAHSLALGDNGRVYSWGNNNSGQLGDGSNTYRTTPVAVAVNGVLAGRTVTQITAGERHSAVLAGGAAFTFGANDFRQLGNGSRSNAGSSVPVAVSRGDLPTGVTITQMDAGNYHTMVIGSDARVYGWGAGQAGQIGFRVLLGVFPGQTDQSVPTAVHTGSLSDISDSTVMVEVVAGREHSLALDDAGNVYGWGKHQYGQIGDGSRTSSTPTWPSQVSFPVGVNIAAIEAGEFHSLARDTNGRVYAWGNGGLGQLGNGSSNNSSSPVAVTASGTLSGVSVTQISAAPSFSEGPGTNYESHSLALGNDGRVYAWGENRGGGAETGLGKLGDGYTSNRTTPVLSANLRVAESSAPVRFGDAAATAATVDQAAGVIRATTPPQEPGVADVSVNVAAYGGDTIGATAWRTVGQFTYLGDPVASITAQRDGAELASGTAAQPGDTIEYTVAFDNRGIPNDSSIDATAPYRALLADMLDDAEFVTPGAPFTDAGWSGSPALAYDDAAQTLSISGTVAADTRATVTFTVAVIENQADRIHDTGSPFDLRAQLLPPAAGAADCDELRCINNPVLAWSVTKLAQPGSGASMNVGGTPNFRVEVAKSHIDMPLTDVQIVEDLTDLLHVAQWDPTIVPPQPALPMGIYFFDADGQLLDSSITADSLPEGTSLSDWIPDPVYDDAAGTWTMTTAAFDLPSDALSAHVRYSVRLGDPQPAPEGATSWNPPPRDGDTPFSTVTHAQAALAGDPAVLLEPNRCGADDAAEQCQTTHTLVSNVLAFRLDALMLDERGEQTRVTDLAGHELRIFQAGANGELTEQLPSDACTDPYTHERHPGDAADCWRFYPIAEGQQQGRWRSENLAAGSYWLVQTRAADQRNADGELLPIDDVELLPAPMPFRVASQADAAPLGEVPVENGQPAFLRPGQMDVFSDQTSASGAVEARCDPNDMAAACVNPTGFLMIVTTVQNPPLPHTGGTGALWLTVAGGTLLAGVLLIAALRRRTEPAVSIMR